MPAMTSLTTAELRSAVKGLLKDADLSALSSKKVRKQLEEKYRVDLTARKQEVDDIVMAVINAEEDESDVDVPGSVNANTAQAHPESSDSSDDDEFRAQNMPHHVAKRSKANGSEKQNYRVQPSSASASDDDGSSDDDDDAEGANDEALARKLQKEELGIRPRSAKPEKRPRKAPKTAENASGKKKRNSQYARECVLSEELAAIVGKDRMARHEVVKRMWQIFRERNLLDPKNKQFVICDAQLETVFKTKKFKAFGMMKVLKNHIKDAELVSS